MKKEITITKDKKKKRIPIHGSFTRPANRQEGVAEMHAGRVPWKKGGSLRVKVTTEEFTSNCPSTGQPDFYKVEISYTPREFYLESKTLKFYLWSFRDAGFHCETLAMQIAKDVHAAIDAADIVVTLTQTPRGGLGIEATYFL